MTRLTFTGLTTYAALPTAAPARDTRSPEDAAALLAGGCECGTEAAAAPEHWAVDPGAPSGETTWSGVIGMEGLLTGDGRLIEPNALRWENLPIPLRYVSEDVGMHDGAVVVGRILTIERTSGGRIEATGDIDMSSEVGREYARLVRERLLTGVSMDLDSVSFEVRVAKELLDGPSLLAVASEDGAEAPEVKEDEDGRVLVMEFESDDEVMVTTDARIRAATGVAIPAFAEAVISLHDAPAPAPEAAASSSSSFARMEPVSDPPPDAVCAFEGCENAPTHVVYDSDEEIEDEVGVLYCEMHAEQIVAADESDDEDEDEGEGEDGDISSLPALAASAGPAAPPTEWFDNPRLSEPTPLTVTEDGRVYGHLAVWGTCHTAYSGQCVEPPHSPSGYAYFRTGAVLTAEGSEVPTGVLTVDTLHAGRSLSAASTLAHYEHTGRGVADVSAGEDAHGVWVAGAVRPSATEEQVRTLRASPLSGDWRRIGTALELVGALAVNVPGFPVPRPQGLVASGVMRSLVASGMLAPTRVIAPGLPGALTEDDLRYLKRLAHRERIAEDEEKAGIQTAAAALAARVRATRVHAMAAARRRR